MRVSAGRWKGRRLEVPDSARPTSSRARESLFDVLGDRIAGARVLDLHAGSGAVGIEAVSRGASRAVLAEKNAAVLARNVGRLEAGGELSVMEVDAEEALRRLSEAGERFEIIFSDPPYGAGARPPSGLEAVLTPGGVVVLQRDAGTPAPEVSGLAHFRQRAYGRNVFDFFTRPPAAGTPAPPGSGTPGNDRD
ncbi:MAG: RsmD family RNA methyltransferase [Acidobacteria bacterium]|nr:RsmD family RNA methyltransferase [Acidobacteriota bacterium]